VTVLLCPCYGRTGRQSLLHATSGLVNRQVRLGSRKGLEDGGTAGETLLSFGL